MRFHMLAPDEMEHYLLDDSSLIIDLRERKDYEKGHIGNAINVPYHDWKNYTHSAEFQKIQKNKNVILYCERGPTSFAAAKELTERGISVSALVGGIRAYRVNLKERY